jgi:hypothetical protein
MIKSCPKCGAYYADDLLAFCLADGCPLTGVDSNSDNWTRGSQAIQEKANGLRRLKRKRLLRWTILGALMTAMTTMVVYGSFEIETTQPVVGSYQISGKVMNATSPLEGIKVILDGAKATSTISGKDGSYSFTGLQAGGNFVVTAVPPPEVSFTQPMFAINALKENALANFMVQPSGVYSISGRVLEETPAKTRGLANVEIKLSGTQSATATTDTDGNYSFTNLLAGSYTVTATPQAQMVFTKPVVTVTSLDKDAAIDFHVQPSFYKISGRVLAGAQGVGKIQINLTGGKTDSTRTDERGNYSFTNLPGNRSYTVTAVPIFVPGVSPMTFTDPSVRTGSLRQNRVVDFHIFRSGDVKPSKVRPAPVDAPAP